MRKETGLSCADAGRRIGVSQSKISRMETGDSGLQRDDVVRLLQLYGVAPARQEEFLALFEDADTRGWWERQPNLPELWRNLIDYENKATRIQNFELAFIPGLLQTAEYCHALLSGMDDTLSDNELANLVAARTSRQTLLLKSTAPQYLAVIDELALHRRIGGPGVMGRQLRSLLDFAQRPNIRIQVVPYSAGAYLGLSGPFVLLDSPDEPPLAFTENQHLAFYLEEPDVQGYREALRAILGKALAPGATLERIASLAAKEA